MMDIQTVTKAGRIRAITIALFVHEGRFLVGECYDPTKAQTFYRPLGGAIEFGEHSIEALRREVREEVNAEITDIRYLGTMENIYIFDGTPGHEIVQVYDATFTDPAIYERDAFMGDEGGNPFIATWMAPDEFNDVTPVYPAGLLEFLRERELVS